MEQLTVKARVAEGKSSQDMTTGEILSKLVLQDENGNYSLTKVYSLVGLILSE